MSTSQLLAGLATLLDAQGVATYRPDAPYAAGDTGIVVGGLPSSPAKVVGLLPYGVEDDPTLSDSTDGVQITCRTGGDDLRPHFDLVDAVFNELHGLHDITLAGGVRVVQCLRQSWTSLGQDSNQRWRTVQNFYVTYHRPSAHRT